MRGRERPRPLALGLLFSLGLLLAPGAQAAAQPEIASSPRLAVDSRGVSPSLERWLRVELRALGVTVSDPSETDQVLTLRPRDDALWVALSGAAPTELSGADEPRVRALQVAEWVRAQWLPLAEIAAQAPEPEAEAEEEIRDEVEPPAPPAEDAAPGPRLEVALGAGWSHSVPLGGLARGMLELDVVVARYLALGAGARGPLMALEIAGAEGRAESYLSTLYGVALGVLPSIGERVFVRLGAEIGAHWLAVFGHATEPLQSRDVHVATAHLGARAQVAVGLTEWLQLELGLSASFALPQPVVRFAGRDLGGFAEPLLDLWLALRATP